jgi:hypothetical protein
VEGVTEFDSGASLQGTLCAFETFVAILYFDEVQSLVRAREAIKHRVIDLVCGAVDLLQKVT